MFKLINKALNYLFPPTTVILHERYRKRGGLTVTGRKGSELPEHQNPRLHYYVAHWAGDPGTRYFVIGIEFNAEKVFLIPEEEMMKPGRRVDRTMLDPVPLSEIKIIERIRRPEIGK